MGVYVYKTTPNAVKNVLVQHSDGSQVNCWVQQYEFAYKPYRSMFDDKINEQLRNRYVMPAVRAFEKKGVKPAQWGVLQEIAVGAPVEDTKGAVMLYDEDARPVVGTVVAVLGKPKRAKPTIDELVAEYTAFRSLEDMCNAYNYRPTIRCVKEYNRAANRTELAELKRMADAYDFFQEKRGDPRRAYRG